VQDLAALDRKGVAAMFAGFIIRPRQDDLPDATPPEKARRNDRFTGAMK
jgi:hypothetical protein